MGFEVREVREWGGNNNNLLEYTAGAFKSSPVFITRPDQASLFSGFS